MHVPSAVRPFPGIGGSNNGQRSPGSGCAAHLRIRCAYYPGSSALRTYSGRGRVKGQDWANGRPTAGKRRPGGRGVRYAIDDSLNNPNTRCHTHYHNRYPISSNMRMVETSYYYRCALFRISRLAQGDGRSLEPKLPSGRIKRDNIPYLTV